MRNTNVMGLIFANMHDEALRDVTEVRALGSVPFGGRYRLIDFALSNLVNAGVSKIGVVTKANFQSLMDHLGSGKAWDLSRKNEGLYILPPFGVTDESYSGRIAALSSLDDLFGNSKEEYVILSDCHAVGNIDYNALLSAHIASGAEITVATVAGRIPALDHTVLPACELNGRITDIAIVNRGEGEGEYGIGLYVMSKELLRRLVQTAVSHNRTDFERDILQRYVDSLRIFRYRVPQTVLVISSLASYFDANIALLRPEVRDEIFLGPRRVYTKVRDRCPAIYGLQSCVEDSLVADGAFIEGTVKHSVIFRDVKIGADATVENCIVMQGTTVLKGSRLNSVVIDKNVLIKEQRTLHGFSGYPVYIGKGAVI